MFRCVHAGKGAWLEYGEGEERRKRLRKRRSFAEAATRSQISEPDGVGGLPKNMIEKGLRWPTAFRQRTSDAERELSIFPMFDGHSEKGILTLEGVCHETQGILGAAANYPRCGLRSEDQSLVSPFSANEFHASPDLNSRRSGVGFPAGTVNTQMPCMPAA